MNNYTVYRHTSPSGKVYIGITSKPVERRWHGGSAYKPNAHFYSAIKKYGWGAFNHEIMAQNLTFEEACRMEISLIAEHDSTNPAKGYNVSKGGDKTTLGFKFSEESRRKISKSLKGKRKNIPLSEEHRKHISEALMGRTVSPEVRAKLRKSMGNRFNTEEARRRQRENTPKGEKHHRAVRIVCLSTNEEFCTIEAAAQAYGVHRSNISACLRGLQKTAGGKSWAYAQEVKEAEK